MTGYTPAADERIVFTGHPSVVRWNGDGSYTPRCPPCGYEGKSVAVHADAENAIRAHMRGRRHRELLLEKQDG